MSSVIVTEEGRLKRKFLDERGPYIRTASTAKFFLADPKPEDFLDVADLAWHLAGINRYTGGSRITVAQHCAVAASMAQRFYPEHPVLPARMTIHDVTEGRYGDVSAPLKMLLPDYRTLELNAERQVEIAYELTYLDDPLVKEVDYRMWLTERLTIYPTLTKHDDYDGALEPFDLSTEELEEYFAPWDPEYAEAEWLATFAHYLPWVNWRNRE